ncbi:hypothetical protein K9N68_24090 [Kovacikia minuta CCNUW1]|uniref:hypothetical protein n=1 Tax=Kovacikia minuta TaxID=2931930 RepID=UPI001CCD87B4|nr:hypothetical protein [Kovacikia minuta]UBF24725.1 hypothetical protein K9N68_24090 [Kovacikia minuta CCNUW1]
MDAQTFNSPFPNCPICHRTGAVKPHKLLKGLLMCQYCRERLVVSWSGHYVRDPFTLKPLLSEQMLRRESRPLARLWRDFKVSGYPWLFAVFGGVVFLGSAFVFLQSSTSGSQLPPPQSFPASKPEP